MQAQDALIEVRYPRVNRSVLVQATHDEHGTLVLPTDPLVDLTGEDLPGDRLTLGQLRHAAGPGVRVEYRPNRAVVVILDPHAQLTAARERRQRRRAEARATSGTGFERAGGPWTVLTADGRGDGRLRAGWQVGAVNVFGSAGTVGEPTWGASVRPWGRTFVSYRDGIGRDPRLSLRSAPGPLFVTLSADPTAPLDTYSGRAALSVGRFTLFGTDDLEGAVTYDAPDWTLTLGGDPQSPRDLTLRLGIGRTFSTFTVPRLNH